VTFQVIHVGSGTISSINQTQQSRQTSPLLDFPLLERHLFAMVSAHNFHEQGGCRTDEIHQNAGRRK
jgi:hypothetical protein